MKKIFVMILSLFFISFLAVQTVKAQENKKVREMMIGEWKLGDIQYSEAYLNKISEKEKKMAASIIEQMKVSTSYNLMQNGEYEIKMNLMGNEDKKSGKWKIDKQGEKFITISEEGKETSQIIEEIGKNKLILKDEEITLILVK